MIKSVWINKQEFMKIIKTHHHKTAQRAAILEYLKDNKSHPNVEDIYEYVSKKLSSISRITVYNTIDLLKEEGLIHEVAMRHHEGRRFDSNLVPYDHLICNICGNIVNVEVDIDHNSLLTKKRNKVSILGKHVSDSMACVQNVKIWIVSQILIYERILFF